MTAPADPSVERHLAWCKLRNLAPNTIRDRRLVLRRLAEYTGRPPSTVTAAGLERWQDTLATISAGTRYRYFSHVRAYFAWLAVTGIRGDDPTGVLVIPRLGTYLPRPIATPDLLRAVTEAPARIRPWLVLAAWAGFRCIEIALLRRESVFELAAEPYIHVTAAATKGNHERIVQMSEPVRAELVPILIRRGFVFPRADGQPGPNTPGRVSQAANQYLRDLGLTDSMHSLRHWFGTEAYAASHDIRVVQELMGHQTPVPTMIYTKISDAAKTAAVAALPPPPGRRVFGAAELAAWQESVAAGPGHPGALRAAPVRVVRRAGGRGGRCRSAR